MMRRILVALCLFLAPPTLAQEAQPASSENILDKAINSPVVDSWSAYGERQRASAIRSSGVLGERAFRVRVGRVADPWSVGAKAPITGQINQGDVLLLAYWARVEEPPEGEATGIISSARVELAVSPYTELFSAPARVTGEWKMYYASGVASRAYAPGEATVTLHLAGARQVIDLGPVFVLNFGSTYDAARLPRNE
jgi:hypothetical protein